MLAIDVEYRDTVRLALSVECVDFIVLSVVETFHGEILVVCVLQSKNCVLSDVSLFHVEEEVVVLL